MKKLTLLFLLASLICLNLPAQTPKGFNYQAVARDASGEILSGQSVGLHIGILQGSAEGEAVYQEVFAPVTNEFGLINIVIGNGSVLYGDFEEIDWSEGPYFVKVQMDPEGGSNYIEMGTSQLLSVPFALHAETSADTFSGDYEDLENLPNLDDMIVVDDPQTGDMLYFSNGNWEAIPLGEEGQVLAIIDGVPQWADVEEDMGNTVMDIDGNVYQIVEINGTEWMAENLKVTKYRNGDDIPKVTENSDWAALETGAFVAYNNNPDHVEVYGNLYNWYAVDDERGLCPEGWRVPTDEEFEDFLYFLDPNGSINDNNAGGKLKHTGTLGDGEGGLWSPPNTGATDQYGFSALPAGGRFSNGSFAGMNDLTYFWSATPTPTDILQRAWIWYMSYNTDTFYRNNYSRKEGYSIRCIKD